MAQKPKQIALSEHYVIIKGTYLVASESNFMNVDDLDQPGLKLAVGKGATYE